VAPADSAGLTTGPQAGPDLADLRVLRRLMLALIAPGDGPPDVAIAGLSAADWHALDDMAWQHRLQPLLHARRGLGSDRANAGEPRRTFVPHTILDRWSAAYRTAGIRALKARAELAETTARLEAAGFAPIALKGAWLAWHAYPNPALRPLRDLDLLLTPETVIPAFELLVSQGYTPPESQEFSLEDAVRLDKHMPPLTSPRGITIELHQRLWEIDGRMDHAAPRADETAIRARAIGIGGITYPHPADMLAHLVIHAVYDHRLDCGPLLLPDIASLLRVQQAQAATFDWAAFWVQAETQGWRGGAALVLELVRAHDPAVAIEVPVGAAPPPAVIDAAADLLLQNLFTRVSAGVVATMAARGPAAFWRRVTARRTDSHDTTAVARDLSGEGGFAQWALTRLRRTVGQLAQSDVRQQSRDLAALSKWLDAGR
jgi:hypothetical protein